ncbi:purple acid phosphatase 15 [Dorcoceras hygrometricum]|uniref:Purple acid phosphatase 15 n=1 Tax=Dorcoceras hygrometricum TaxID=472368 RepID=A0A2Z7AWL5_9LAMI|nr:purple acid phosphatase 15 [Dorcoceras hygrometricum]
MHEGCQGIGHLGQRVSWQIRAGPSITHHSSVVFRHEDSVGHDSDDSIVPFRRDTPSGRSQCGSQTISPEHGKLRLLKSVSSVVSATTARTAWDLKSVKASHNLAQIQTPTTYCLWSKLKSGSTTQRRLQKLKQTKELLGQIVAKIFEHCKSFALLLRDDLQPQNEKGSVNNIYQGLAKEMMENIGVENTLSFGQHLYLNPWVKCYSGSQYRHIQISASDPSAMAQVLESVPSVNSNLSSQR